MLKVDELFSDSEYQNMKAQGYVRENDHSTLDLKILNYTEKAQYDGEWNNVTTQCRGLIVNSEGLVVARPFDKFLNYGQNLNDHKLMDERVVVTDKLDGSLGILWTYEGEQGIATRGSFTSDQAIHATYLWKMKYGFDVAPNWTYLFEIIYPENRIVLDYGLRDELILLGVRDNEDGYVLLPEQVVTWRGPRATTFPYKTLREALAAPQRFNAEGFVVYFPDQDYRVKIKQDDYVALHKIVTGLTERRVWENLSEGKTLIDMLEIIPDEWHEWLKTTVRELTSAFAVVNMMAHNDYSQIRKELEKNFGADGWSRKDFAELATSGPVTNYPDLVFSLLDGRDISSAIWKKIRPKAEV